MSEFMKPPVLVLASMEDVRRAMNDPKITASRKEIASDPWLVKSIWLIELIDEIAATGEYPYNSTVKHLAEQRLGLPPQSHAYYAKEGDTLSLLIYNAQRFRGSDRLTAAGFSPLTQDMLIQAFNKKLQIELWSDNLFGGASLVRLNVKLINDMLYAMKPRKRHYAVQVLGQPARLVKRNSKPLDFPHTKAMVQVVEMK